MCSGFPCRSLFAFFPCEVGPWEISFAAGTLQFFPRFWLFGAVVRTGGRWTVLSFPLKHVRMSDEEDAYLIDFQAGDSVDLMAMVPGNLGSGVVVSNDNSHPARVLVQPAGGPGQPAPVLVERRHLRAGGDQVMVLVGRSRDSDCYLAESGGALCWNPALAGQTTNKPNYGVLMVGNGELRVRASINIPVSLTCAKPDESRLSFPMASPLRSS